jgi:hypothetical protein
MKAAPVRVFMIDWSRKLLNACANGASSEPEVDVATAQLGIVGRGMVVVLEFTVVLLVVLLLVWSIWTPMSGVIVCIKEPLVPVTWTANVPVEALWDAEIVRIVVALPDSGVTGDMEDKLTPEGTAPIHAADSATVELNPFRDITAIVVDLLSPWFSVMVEVAAIKKSGGAEVELVAL